MTSKKHRDAMARILEENAQLQAKLTELALSRACLRGALEDARGAARALSSFMLLAGPVSALPGVYFLLNTAGEIVYVWQSQNVAVRMGGHAGKEFTHVRMLHIPDPMQRDEFEQRMIGLLAPPYNVAHAGPGRKGAAVEAIAA